MTGLTAMMVIVGLVLIVDSFFVTEKMTPDEVNKIAKMNMEDIKVAVEKEMKAAVEKGKENFSEEIEDMVLENERNMEKQSIEKINSINDFSDNVLESMNKTHNENMFLYSMLNDKHKELTDFAGELKELQSKLLRTRDSIERETEEAEMNSIMENAPEMINVTEVIKESVNNGDSGADESQNHNEEILSLYNLEKDEMEIAKELGLGIGEVKLVLDLFREREE
ncbi:MAG: hypothetical protein K6F37_10055 [Lachnospiraceae bacterium]|nr:hypothetical protein [Lachnospiraceae bacterium]